MNLWVRNLIIKIKNVRKDEIMYQKIVRLLEMHGYEKVVTNAGPCYLKSVAEQKKGVLILYDKNPDGSGVEEEQIWQMIRQVKFQIGEEIPVLIIIFSENGQPVFADPEHKFDELYEPVSLVLASAREEKRDVRTRKAGLAGKPWITIMILAVNLILFAVSEIYGDAVYDAGACSSYLVLKMHEYYRLITSNYLHYGWDHFFNNMVVLLILGTALERQLGHVRYFILYTAAGVLSSLVSVYYYAVTQVNVMSAGASGAIFGITGALAAMFLFDKEIREDFNGLGIFIMIAGSIYHGFQNSGIDNAAHIGGCAAGFILALVLHVLHKGRSK